MPIKRSNKEHTNIIYYQIIFYLTFAWNVVRKQLFRSKNEASERLWEEQKVPPSADCGLHHILEVVWQVAT